MHSSEFLAACLGGARTVVDVSRNARFRNLVTLPPGVSWRAATEGHPGDIPHSAPLVAAVVEDASRIGPVASELAKLPERTGAVIFVPWVAAHLPRSVLWGEMARHGLAVLQAVDVEDLADMETLGAVWVMRAEEPLKSLLGEVDGSEQAVDSEEQSLKQALASAHHEIATLRDRIGEDVARIRDLQADLAAARSRLRAVQSSRTMQVGQALADIARDPLQGLRRLPGRVGRLRRRAVLKPGVQPPSHGTIRSFEAQLPADPSDQAMRLRFVVPDSLYVPRRLEEGGFAEYEPETLACFLGLSDCAGPGAIWDVGANVGVYALLGRALTNREVVGFEPTPELARWARRIADDNDLCYRLEQIAAGDSETLARFYLSDSTDSSSSLAAGFRSSKEQIEVVVERLDRFAARSGSVPAILKIDTETTEPAVLQGAMDTIRRHRPWILCEVLKGRSEAALTQVMQQLDYRWFHITDEVPLVQQDKIVGDPSYKHFMWLFAPEAPSDDLWERMRAWRAKLAHCGVVRN